MTDISNTPLTVWMDGRSCPVRPGMAVLYDHDGHQQFAVITATAHDGSCDDAPHRAISVDSGTGEIVAFAVEPGKVSAPPDTLPPDQWHDLQRLANTFATELHDQRQQDAHDKTDAHDKIASMRRHAIEGYEAGVLDRTDLDGFLNAHDLEPYRPESS